jgi:putative transposase
MTRPLRIELAGGLYHVTSRGDRREDIYASDEDRLLWLEIFSETCKRFNWVCHAWCLMTNHYHIVVETIEGNLSRGMRHLNGIYTQATNRKYRRVGHLFQGRYKGILVEKDSYLLELARYVVLNPVRAGMVGSCGEWPWSSYGAMIGTAQAPEWLQTDWLLAQFGRDRKAAVEAYIAFVRAGIGLPALWSDLRNQVFLGSEVFVLAMQSHSEGLELTEIPRAQRRRAARPLQEYDATAESRQHAMALAYASGDYTMQEIARYFGVHYSSVSRAVRQIGTNAGA